MIRSFSAVLVALSLAASTAAFADDRPDHYEGKSAENLEQALANFSEYNKKFAAILAKKELVAADMHQVHELTYTMENALEKIRDELEDLADTLEEVHQASESADIAEVKKHGQIYLDTARKVIK